MNSGPPRGNEGPATSGPHRGVVGQRDLVAIQTFDISRLTTHTVPIIPGTFIAVSGVGPDGDSNGSGKTTFLSAVSILLADPQWRLDVNGGKNAMGLLFKPEAAGVDPGQKISAAPYGYIVGVFASDPVTHDDALTVWVRVSNSSPFVEARWKLGLHVVSGASDAERTLQADDLWRSCSPGSTISAKRLAAVLYGDSPRCLSYLDTPLRPPVPSLLSQQMVEMSPQAIGDSLISLSGLKPDLEAEETQRSQHLEQSRLLAEAIANDTAASLDEDAELAGVNARLAARKRIDTGKRFWQLYVAARLVKAHDADGPLAEKEAEHCERFSEARDSNERLHHQLEQLRKRTGLDAEEARTGQLWDETRGEVEDQRIARASLTSELEKLASEKIAARGQAEGWSGATVEAAENTCQEAERGLLHAHAAMKQTETTLGAAADLLRKTRDGLAGTAGQAVEVLAAAGFDSAALFDIAEFPLERRAMWEARLWPWRDAVVVAHERTNEARDLLAAQLPGAQVVSATPSDSPSTLAERGHEAIIEFLGLLEAQAKVRGEHDDVFYTALEVSVAGGFEFPVVGREARLSAAQRGFDEATTEVTEAKKHYTHTESILKLARNDLAAAKAWRRLQEIGQQSGAISKEIADIDERLTELTGVAGSRRTAWETAKLALATRAQEINLAEARLKLAKKNEEELAKHLETVQKRRDDLRVGIWLQLWASDQGVEGAREFLGAELADSHPRPEALKRRSSEALKEALKDLGVVDDNRNDAPGDLREAAELRDRYADADDAKGPEVVFGEVSAPLLNRLAGAADSDRVVSVRISALRRQRSEALIELDIEAQGSAGRLEKMQDMLESHIESIFATMSQAFNRLDIARGGDGAQLEFSSARPDGPGEWRWLVTPRWRRSRAGAMVSYREVSHGAQVKVHAILLVLAAMLADAEPEGRVLILDELGNSLGEVNRQNTLRALQQVARERHVTILGTCQDSVLSDAADCCGELLWFHHPTRSHAVNQPTRVWGFDESSERVELTADWLAAGRPDV